jgi:hypothetical protein
MAKDYEDDISLFEELMEKLDEEEGEKPATTVEGDKVSLPQQPMMQQSRGGGSGSSGLGTALTIAKLGASLAGVPLPFEEGGQIKKKTKKKKKRVIRGCGAAKRGFGKATYSKKMY